MTKREKQFEITWHSIDPQEPHNGRFVGSEDAVEVIAGRLMDSFWDPKHGWAVKYKIKELKSG